MKVLKNDAKVLNAWFLSFCGKNNFYLSFVRANKSLRQLWRRIKYFENLKGSKNSRKVVDFYAIPRWSVYELNDRNVKKLSK